MEWIVWLLFESLPASAAVLFTINFVLLVHWRRSGRPRPLLVGLAAAAFLLILQALVVTRREHAARILAGIERDVVTERTDALAAALAPDFRAGGMGRDQFIAYVQRQYEKVRIRSVNCSELRIQDSQPDQFVVAAAYQADIVHSEYSGFLRTRWEITLVRTEAGWQISHVRPTFIDGIPNPDWDEIDHR